MLTDIEKEQIEQLLRSYKSLVSKININIINTMPDYSLPAINYSNVAVGQTYTINREIENYVIKKVDNNQEFINMIKKRSIIESAYNCLDEEKKSIVNLCYFENKPYVIIAKIKKISESSVYRLREKALESLNENGILEAAKCKI